MSPHHTNHHHHHHHNSHHNQHPHNGGDDGNILHNGTCDAFTYCFKLFTEEDICIQRATVFVTCVLALMIGIYGFIRIHRKVKSRSRNLYSVLWFSYGIMMSSAGVLHCLLGDKAAPHDSDFIKWLRFAVGLVDVGLTSSIGWGFGVVGLVDLFNAPKLIWVHVLGTLAIFFAWAVSLLTKRNWFLILYFAPIALGCGTYMISQLVLYWRYQKVEQQPQGESLASQRDDAGFSVNQDETTSVPVNSATSFNGNQYSTFQQQPQQHNAYPSSNTYPQMGGQQVPPQRAAQQQQAPLYYQNSSAWQPRASQWNNQYPSMYPSVQQAVSEPSSQAIGTSPVVKKRKLPGLFWLVLGGISGFIGVLLCFPLSAKWCEFMGPTWGKYFGSEFMWFILSDAAMIFNLFYVIKSDVLKKKKN